MKGGRPTSRTGVAAIAAAVLVGGCSGEERQDADEPGGTYRVDVGEVSFPTDQRLAQQSTFAMTVRNAGSEAVPNLAVTLRGFSSRPDEPAGEPARGEGTGRAAQPGAPSDPERPVWILDGEPAGGVTAYDDTWTAGRLEPGASRTLRWRVTPVVAGEHVLRYRVASGLDGKGEVFDAGGFQPEGEISVMVDEEPSAARVDPETGRVERLQAPEG